MGDIKVLFVHEKSYEILRGGISFNCWRKTARPIPLNGRLAGPKFL
jgi:hypothetical protein